MLMILRALLLSAWAFSASAFDFSQSGGRDGTVVVITQAGCYHCERLENEILQPLRASGLFNNGVAFAEVSLDPGNPVAGFDGTRLEGREFAHQYGAFGTPTLLFLDANGQLLDQPWFGVPDAIDFYGAKIENAVAAMTQSR